MKTLFPIVTLLLAFSSTGVVLAEEKPADAAPTPLPPANETTADPPAPARRAALRAKMLEKFDADKDGKLSETERAAAKASVKENGGEVRAKVLEKFDADKDGKLSPSEREIMKAAMKARGQNAKKGAEGDGKAEKRRQEMLQQFDEDKDGQLNEAERAKARAARKAKASQPAKSAGTASPAQPDYQLISFT